MQCTAPRSQRHRGGSRLATPWQGGVQTSEPPSGRNRRSREVLKVAPLEREAPDGQDSPDEKPPNAPSAPSGSSSATEPPAAAPPRPNPLRLSRPGSAGSSGSGIRRLPEEAARGTPHPKTRPARPRRSRSGPNLACPRGPDNEQSSSGINGAHHGSTTGRFLVVRSGGPGALARTALSRLRVSTGSITSSSSKNVATLSALPAA